MKQKNVQNIYDELVSTYQNLKAEVFVTEILENSDLELTDIDIFNHSTFSRSYRRDVIDFKLDSYSSNTDKIQMNLARNGIYDTLPEGLFHDTVKTKNDVSYNEIRKKHKAQEKDARSFFSPIENEFFVQKVNIEQNERALINKFTNLKNNFLLEFWKLGKDIPAEYSIKMLQLLPYAHNISGNLNLTALSLEKIVNETVSIKRKDKRITEKINQSLNNAELGVDLVLDLQESSIAYPNVEITIGPVKKENIDNYVENSITIKFISIFCDYFIPIEIDTEINVIYSTKEGTFILDKTNGPRMGLMTII